ncbi:SH3 domain-containing protein [Dyadobacter sp. OTU695]|uniref:SH3 domain-containing protein n=1 Tax=Dyadobacter sp. OTU695 TaxID=3043860 RepID=UPI00313F3C39
MNSFDKFQAITDKFASVTDHAARLTTRFDAIARFNTVLPKDNFSNFAFTAKSHAIAGLANLGDLRDIALTNPFTSNIHGSGITALSSEKKYPWAEPTNYPALAVSSKPSWMSIDQPNWATSAVTANSLSSPFAKSFATDLFPKHSVLSQLLGKTSELDTGLSTKSLLHTINPATAVASSSLLGDYKSFPSATFNAYDKYSPVAVLDPLKSAAAWTNPSKSIGESIDPLKRALESNYLTASISSSFVVKGFATTQLSSPITQLRALRATLWDASSPVFNLTEKSSFFSGQHLKDLGRAGVLTMLAAIPATTIADINIISNSQARLTAVASDLLKGYHSNIGSFTSRLDIETENRYLKLSALPHVLGKQTFEFTTAAIANQRWDAIEEFSRLNSEVVEITETAIADDGRLHEIIDRVKALIEHAKSIIGHHLTSPTSWFCVLMLLHTYFMDIHQYMDFLTSEEAATKEDIVTIKNEIEQLKAVFTEQEYSVAVHSCTVYLKPKDKGKRLGKIASGTRMVVLDTHKKWVYVSFQDDEDNFDRTGWILKKYVRKIDANRGRGKTIKTYSTQNKLIK